MVLLGIRLKEGEEMTNKFLNTLLIGFIGFSSWISFAGGSVSGGIIKPNLNSSISSGIIKPRDSSLAFSVNRDKKIDFTWRAKELESLSAIAPNLGNQDYLEFLTNYLETPNQYYFMGLTEEQEEILNSIGFIIKGWSYDQDDNLIIIESEVFPFSIKTTEGKILIDEWCKSNTRNYKFITSPSSSDLIFEGQDWSFITRYLNVNDPMALLDLTERQRNLADCMTSFK